MKYLLTTVGLILIGLLALPTATQETAEGCTAALPVDRQVQYELLDDVVLLDTGITIPAEQFPVGAAMFVTNEHHWKRSAISSISWNDDPEYFTDCWYHTGSPIFRQCNANPWETYDCRVKLYFSSGSPTAIEYTIECDYGNENAGGYKEHWCDIDGDGTNDQCIFVWGWAGSPLVTP